MSLHLGGKAIKILVLFPLSNKFRAHARCHYPAKDLLIDLVWTFRPLSDVTRINNLTYHVDLRTFWHILLVYMNLCRINSSNLQSHRKVTSYKYFNRSFLFYLNESNYTAIFNHISNLCTI